MFVGCFWGGPGRVSTVFQLQCMFKYRYDYGLFFFISYTDPTFWAYQCIKQVNGVGITHKINVKQLLRDTYNLWLSIYFAVFVAEEYPQHTYWWTHTYCQPRLCQPVCCSTCAHIRQTQTTVNTGSVSTQYTLHRRTPHQLSTLTTTSHWTIATTTTSAGLFRAQYSHVLSPLDVAGFTGAQISMCTHSSGPDARRVSLPPGLSVGAKTLHPLCLGIHHRCSGAVLQWYWTMPVLSLGILTFYMFKLWRLMHFYVLHFSLYVLSLSSSLTPFIGLSHPQFVIIFLCPCSNGCGCWVYGEHVRMWSMAMQFYSRPNIHNE